MLINIYSYYFKFSNFFSQIFEVFNAIKSINDTWKWYHLGYALRLRPETVDASLSHVLEMWLGKNYNVKKFGEPTWRQLVKAVGHPDGGADMVLAMEIAERHKARGMSRVLVAVETKYYACHLVHRQV